MKTAAKLRLRLLVRDAVAQHDVDGGTILNAGRMVYLLGPEIEKLEDEYLCLELFVDSPNRYNPSSNLPDNVIHMHNHGRGFRVLPVPPGQEMAWLKVAAEKAGISI